jgi:hypothetical protein
MLMLSVANDIVADDVVDDPDDIEEKRRKRRRRIKMMRWRCDDLSD